MNRPKYPPLVNVSAVGLADAYAKLVKECMKNGALKRRFYGKPVNTYDIVSLAEIWKPMLEPMLHPDFPTKELHLAEYEKQWGREYDWIKQDFAYNYMDRLTWYPVSAINYAYSGNGNSRRNEYYNLSGYSDFIDQLKVIREKVAERISKGGECLISNRDQVITWIPDRDLFVSDVSYGVQEIYILLGIVI